VYPSPEISGKYLPHPKTGGRDRAKEYSQTKDIIFAADIYEDSFPSKLPILTKHIIRFKDSAESVIIETKPKLHK
jgi:hypothetical protein